MVEKGNARQAFLQDGPVETFIDLRKLPEELRRQEGRADIVEDMHAEDVSVETIFGLTLKYQAL